MYARRYIPQLPSHFKPRDRFARFLVSLQSYQNEYNKVWGN